MRLASIGNERAPRVAEGAERREPSPAARFSPTLRPPPPNAEDTQGKKSEANPEPRPHIRHRRRHKARAQGTRQATGPAGVRRALLLTAYIEQRLAAAHPVQTPYHHFSKGPPAPAHPANNEYTTPPCVRRERLLTAAHIEQRLAAARMLGAGAEFGEWVRLYALHLAQPPGDIGKASIART